MKHDSRTVAAIVLILGFFLVGWRTSAHELAVEMRAGSPLLLARVVGQQRLVYELHVTNVSDVPVELTALDILDANGKPFLHLEQKALGTRTDMKNGDSILAAHAQAVVYLTVDFGTTSPTVIQHRLTVKQGGAESVIAGPRVPVVATAGSVLAAAQGRALGRDLQR